VSGAPILAAVIIGPALLAYVLGRTPAWWLPGAAVAVVGVYFLWALDRGDNHGDDALSAWSDIGNFVRTATGICLLVYAPLLVLAGRARRRGPRKPPPPLPPAKS
jgi:hypothetical protein